MQHRRTSVLTEDDNFSCAPLFGITGMDSEEYKCRGKQAEVISWNLLEIVYALEHMDLIGKFMSIRQVSLNISWNMRILSAI